MIVKHGLLGLALVGSLAVLAASVVAGSGWLLLAPPVQNQGRFDTDAPLHLWEQLRALDKAGECESLKERLQEHERSVLGERFDEPAVRPEAKLSRECEDFLTGVSKKEYSTSSLEEDIRSVREKPQPRVPPAAPTTLSEDIRRILGEPYRKVPPSRPAVPAEAPSTLREDICRVLKEDYEKEAKLTPEEKEQLQKEWEEGRARRMVEFRDRQAKAQVELARLEHAKCVPADAVYRAPK